MSADRPQISYYDATNGDLKIAWAGMLSHRLARPVVVRGGP